MTIWTQKSIELANQRDYLDQLYKIYPMANNLKRELAEDVINELTARFAAQDSVALIDLLLQQELFPIKDSYVAYLRKDRTAINRNPNTVNRIAGMLYELGFDKMINLMSVPKETNRQIGPLFKNWIRKNSLGAELVTDTEFFFNSQNNMVLNLDDTALMKFAQQYLGYSRDKGLDFIAKFNNNFVVGEAKFLTDFGGHQNAQFEDALQTLGAKFSVHQSIIPIAILDGVLYITGGNKLHRTITNLQKEIVISALFLRDFLYSI